MLDGLSLDPPRPRCVRLCQGADLKLLKAAEAEAPGLLYGRINSVQIETRTKQVPGRPNSTSPLILPIIFRSSPMAR